MASVRERITKSGQRTYSVLFRAQGKQTSVTFTDAAKADHFRQVVELLGADRALATLTEGQVASITLDELAESFFAWKARDVTERTMTDYRRDYRNWIGPAFGAWRAASLNELDVQRWVDGMAKRNLQPKSVADRHSLLHAMYRFGAAKSRRLVEHNPCLETQLPKRHKKPPKGVTLDEWRVLYAAAQQVEPDAADLMMFIAGTGWRWSEAAALTVGNVEEYASRDGQVRMRATMSGVMRAGERAEGAAKSRAGFRRVTLPEVAAAVVRRRVAGKRPADLVFTNAAGRKWYQQNFLNRTWARIVETSGLDRYPTPHMLRHTHVALLDRAGVSLPEMQRRLGHESIETTINVYGGMIDDMSTESLDALNALLSTDPRGAVVRGDVVRGELG